MTSVQPGTTRSDRDLSDTTKKSPGALPHEHPQRSAKGDLGWNVAPGFGTKPLSHDGQPFKLEPKE
jgi:hypothetical protein